MTKLKKGDLVLIPRSGWVHEMYFGALAIVINTYVRNAEAYAEVKVQNDPLDRHTKCWNVKAFEKLND